MTAIGKSTAMQQIACRTCEQMLRQQSHRRATAAKSRKADNGNYETQWPQSGTKLPFNSCKEMSAFVELSVPIFHGVTYVSFNASKENQHMNARPSRPSMGIATQATFKNKNIYKRFLDSFDDRGLVQIKDGASVIFAPNAAIEAAHPINQATGADGYFGSIIVPMAKALRGFQRRNEILIGGEYLGAEWVTSMGYFLWALRRSDVRNSPKS